MKKEILELTENQYRILIKLIYLGKWMYDSYRIEQDKEIENLEQHIFSLSEKFKTENLVYFNDEFKNYFPTRNLEDQIHDLVDQYNDYTFWEELIHRLARRDFINKFGEEIISEMDVKQILEHEQPLIDKYEHELEKNGIDNLVLKNNDRLPIRVKS